MRLAREATPIMTTQDTPFEIGKAYVYAAGQDITIIATGTMTYQALVAAENYKKTGLMPKSFTSRPSSRWTQKQFLRVFAKPSVW